jgi:signal transduction histidine kinase
MHDGRRDTYFAPPERSTGEALTAARQRLMAHPLVQQLLDSFPEAAMILNEQRQIVLANDKLALLLERHRDGLVGNRPGEALRCIHAGDSPAGCGTTEFCKYCGAVNAIVMSQRDERVAVRECRITRDIEGMIAALDLRVWATPLTVDGEHFTVFALHDTTDEKRRDILERLFFHDVLNAAGNLRNVLDIWPELSADEIEDMTRLARRSADQLVEQLLAQRDLTRAEHGDLRTKIEDVDVPAMLSELCAMYSHYALTGKQLAPPRITGHAQLRSDAALLRRVLGNLIKNALEASHQGQTVTVCFENGGPPRFSVHNESVMSEAVRAQVFQRSFSTKGGNGRGLGCYSVKLLTEGYLGGHVTFTSTPDAGTTFTVQLPESK